MKKNVSLDGVYITSNDLVVREIEDEIIIIPFAPDGDDKENSPYTLNSTGKEIWQRLDGNKRLKDIVKELISEFKSPAGEIEKDVIVLIEELLQKNLLREVGGT
jgi:hypothetical protein